MHFVRIPCNSMAYSLGRIDKQALLFILQIPGRYIISALHRTLSGDVPLLRLVDQKRTLLARRNLGGCDYGLCDQRHPRIRLPETLR